ncbi:hypothetical protein H4219_006089 [Mycoemilia scoparia]|uniref:Uncharacterized protein n=1 Tax=Mycoemilia scoparia TaxID=417184 RepID=A0A9W7ZQI6_9FUNG|nr:hypothetical protein H4219_006089 [Mycoemilia scoparia]
MNEVVTTKQPEVLSPEVLSRFLDLISPLMSEGKSDKTVHVGPWLADTKDRLESFSILPNYWVMLAKMKLPSLVNNEYNEWAATNTKDKKEWDVFEEFLLRKYAGVANQLDAFLKWSSLASPRNAKEFDKFIEDFKLLATMAKLDPASTHCAMNFLSRMPNTIVQRMMANANDQTTITLESVISYSRAHFTALQMRDESNKMDINAISTIKDETPRVTHVEAVQYQRLPKYEWFKNVVTKDKFDDRLARRVCIGCGERHLWRNCPKHPKARQN